MNSRTLMLSTLVVMLFLVGCEDGQSATATMRPTERLNGTWRPVGMPPEAGIFVFLFGVDKGFMQHPWLVGTDGTNTIKLTQVEETAEKVTFEARDLIWTCTFNDDGTVALRAAGQDTVQLERADQ